MCTYMYTCNTHVHVILYMYMYVYIQDVRTCDVHVCTSTYTCTCTCMYMYRIKCINSRMLEHVMYIHVSLHIYLIKGLSILLSIAVTGGNIGASIGRGLVGSCEICSTTYEYNYNINY